MSLVWRPLSEKAHHNVFLSRGHRCLSVVSSEEIWYVPRSRWGTVPEIKEVQTEKRISVCTSFAIISYGLFPHTNRVTSADLDPVFFADHHLRETVPEDGVFGEGQPRIFRQNLIREMDDEVDDPGVVGERC